MNIENISQDPEMYSLEVMNSPHSEEITFYAKDNFSDASSKLTLTIKEIEVALNMYYVDKDHGVN